MDSHFLTPVWWILISELLEQATKERFKLAAGKASCKNDARIDADNQLHELGVQLLEAEVAPPHAPFLPPRRRQYKRVLEY